jgi:hypothetical protein
VEWIALLKEPVEIPRKSILNIPLYSATMVIFLICLGITAESSKNNVFRILDSLRRAQIIIFVHVYYFGLTNDQTSLQKLSRPSPSGSSSVKGV